MLERIKLLLKMSACFISGRCHILNSSLSILNKGETRTIEKVPIQSYSVAMQDSDFLTYSLQLEK